MGNSLRRKRRYTSELIWACLESKIVSGKKLKLIESDLLVVRDFVLSQSQFTVFNSNREVRVFEFVEVFYQKQFFVVG